MIMIKPQIYFGKGRKKKSNFNTSHEFIEDAVQNYLQNGGKITYLSPENAEIDNIPGRDAVDDFLIGK